MVATHAGWLHAVNQLVEEVEALKAQKSEGGEDISKKAEVKALKKISKPADATNEDIAAAVNAIIAALKA